MSDVVIYADGACRGNPGPGGWGVLLSFGDKTSELYGGERQTTNNRMELTAVIKALEALTRPFYAFFRRFIPPIGNIDLSPVFILLGAQIAVIVLNQLSQFVATAL